MGKKIKKYLIYFHTGRLHLVEQDTDRPDHCYVFAIPAHWDIKKYCREPLWFDQKKRTLDQIRQVLIKSKDLILASRCLGICIPKKKGGLRCIKFSKPIKVA